MKASRRKAAKRLLKSVVLPKPILSAQNPLQLPAQPKARLLAQQRPQQAAKAPLLPLLVQKVLNPSLRLSSLRLLQPRLTRILSRGTKASTSKASNGISRGGALTKVPSRINNASPINRISSIRNTSSINNRCLPCRQPPRSRV